MWSSFLMRWRGETHVLDTFWHRPISSICKNVFFVSFSFSLPPPSPLTKQILPPTSIGHAFSVSLTYWRAITRSSLTLRTSWRQPSSHPSEHNYTFNCSCFGLRNFGSTFQQLMHSILGDLDFCTCYIDDILIFSRNLQEHQQHL